MTKNLFFKLSVSLFLAFPFFALQAQNQTDPTGIWRDVAENTLNFSEAERPILPLQYRAVGANLVKLKNLLATAPQALMGNPVESMITVYLPMPDGKTEAFAIFNAPIMEAPLAAQHPEIQTYAGHGLDDRHATVRFSVTPFGFNAIVLSPKGTVFIDPYATSTTDYYVSYYTKNYTRKNLPEWTCQTDHSVHPKPAATSTSNGGFRYGDCKFRRYRLAVACTGEYSVAVAGASPTVPAVLAKIVISVNRVNALYEVDLAVTMILVADETNIIYLNGATDPYTNGNGGTMLGQNQTNCDAVIGTANYDIGHVFSTGGGGVASLQAPCDVSIKARGVTGSSTPQGDVFDMDYVAHEMGHQFGSNHTFAGNAGSCNGNSNAGTAYEPGSGSTIMAYAGICTAAQNVQTFGAEQSNIGISGAPGASDVYFHASSLNEINAYIIDTRVGYGGFCPVQLGTGALPSLPTLTNYSIPNSTPFTLPGTTASGTGSFLYCWEQYNASTSAPVPVATSTAGVNFRSYLPTASTDRTVPRLASIIGGTNTNTWEVLSSIARTVTWNYTVRAIQSVGGVSIGCTANRTSTVATCAGASMSVTSPNTAVSYSASSLQTVTWTPGCATCANVDILISTDGGQTFSVLVAGIPNDGTEAVTMPGTQTTTARIQVKCSNNIFFDMSNVNFIISAPLPIELISFTAKADKRQVNLAWSSADETGFKGFSLERSIDPRKEFSPIYWEAGKGSSAGNRYQFEDKNVVANVIYYYRLKQIDTDGSFKYSNITSAQLLGKNEWNVALTPNPATTEFALQLNEPAQGDLKVAILGANGQLIFEETINYQDIEKRTFELSNLQSGLYLVRISDDVQTVVKKLVKR